MATTVGKKTDEAYWSGLWSTTTLPKPIDIADNSIANHGNLARHRYLSNVLGDLRRGSRLLEIGAAQSRWLPYFHKQFGFAPTGLDYSEIGCERARELLVHAGVPGEVVCADLFSPPAGLLGRFDAVVSFGVVEHFDDTAGCLAALASYLKPGGRVVTTIPNMAGGLGLLQRWVDRTIFETHVPLTDAELARAHVAAGLEVVDSGYLLSANWRSVATGNERLSRPAERLIRHGLSVTTKLMWQAERLGFGLPPNRLTSPYVCCTALRPSPETASPLATAQV